jgi:cardiolipin synthase A/B
MGLTWMKHWRTVGIAASVALWAIALTACQPAIAPTIIPAPTATSPATAAVPTNTVTPTSAALAPSLFILPDDGIAPVRDALGGARKSIQMVMYLLSEPQIIAALKDAASRGVEVRLILEKNPFGGGSGNEDVGNDLAKAGVQLKWDNPAFTYTHEKAIIVDDETLVLMTGNLTRSTFSANREYGIFDRNADDIAEVQKVFEADWNRSKVDLSRSRLTWAPDNARRRILQLFDSARSSIAVEHQDCQDEEMLTHLIAAVRRGVTVRYISSAQQPLDQDTDEPGRKKLRDAGVQIRYMNVPYVHAKMFVIDRKRAFVGSQNMTTNSLDFNRELGMVVEDPVVVRRILERYEADWKTGTIEAFAKDELPLPAIGYIEHKDARQFQDRIVAVQMTVTQIHNSGRVIWLMPDADQGTNFKVVIFSIDYGKWPQSPDAYYQGKTIRARGLIEIYQDWPEMIVNDPRQIEIVP